MSLINVLSGGLAEKLVDKVSEYFPPSMSDAEKAKLQINIERTANEQERLLLKAAVEQTAEFNRRIAEMEGTAKDLKSIPFLGAFILFLRGVQRPAWGFATMYMDAMWFSGKWGALTQTQESALWLINLLVLIFLFGERAFKNVAPLLENMIKARFGDAK